jgi:hypothetical protein
MQKKSGVFHAEKRGIGYDTTMVTGERKGKR